MNVIVCSVY